MDKTEKEQMKEFVLLNRKLTEPGLTEEDVRKFLKYIELKEGVEKIQDILKNSEIKNGIDGLIHHLLNKTESPECDDPLFYMRMAAKNIIWGYMVDKIILED